MPASLGIDRFPGQTPDQDYFGRASAPANIAFLKYWGRADHEKFIPLNPSISMSLDSCRAETEVAFVEPEGIEAGESTVTIELEDSSKEIFTASQAKSGALDEKTTLLFTTAQRLQERAAKTNPEIKNLVFQAESRLNFPMNSGISSSAAGLAAFVAAVAKALELDELYKNSHALSREIRLCGSPSASRSVFGGFSEVLAGSDREAIAQQLAPADHWELIDIVVAVEKGAKKVSSSEGHLLADNSPMLTGRVDYLKDKPELFRRAILDRDFATLAEISTADWLNMFAVMFTSTPPIVYFQTSSITVFNLVEELRADDVEVFVTFDAGPNPHVITTPDSLPQVESALRAGNWGQLYINRPGEGLVIDQNSQENNISFTSAKTNAVSQRNSSG